MYYFPYYLAPSLPPPHTLLLTHRYMKYLGARSQENQFMKRCFQGPLVKQIIHQGFILMKASDKESNFQKSSDDQKT